MIYRKIYFITPQFAIHSNWKKPSSIIEYTKISTHISDERNITQSTSTIGSSQKTGKFKQ